MKTLKLLLTLLLVLSILTGTALAVRLDLNPPRTEEPAPAEEPAEEAPEAEAPAEEAKSADETQTEGGDAE